MSNDAPTATVEAVIFDLQEHGATALDNPICQRRLGELSEGQLSEVSGRVSVDDGELFQCWRIARDKCQRDAQGSAKKANGRSHVNQGERQRVCEPDGAVAHEWPEPTPLPDGLSPVASFDGSFLPESVAPWVMDISDRMQCPPDFVGVAAFVALGSVLGRKIGIRPQERDNWLEVPNLWGAVVARPGALKTPAINEAMKPIHQLEGTAREAHMDAVAVHENDMRVHELRVEAAEKTAKAQLKKDPDAPVFLNLGEPKAPIERRYLTNDTRVQTH